MQKILLLLCIIATSLSTNAQVGNSPCNAFDVNFVPNPCDTINSFLLPPVAAVTTQVDSSIFCFDRPIRNDVWVKFTVPNYPAAGIRFKMYSASDTLGYALYHSPTGLCSDLVGPDSCGLPKIITTNGYLNGSNGRFAFYYPDVNVGETYWLRMWETQPQAIGMTFKTGMVVLNDNCINAFPLEGTSCNYGASGSEAENWTPVGQQFTCQSGYGWSANDNTIWYKFEVTGSTPQPVTIRAYGAKCYDGGSNLQIGIWTNNTNSCSLDTNPQSETLLACAYGIDTVSIVDVPLPLGDYYFVVDGGAGAQCRFQLESAALLGTLVNDGPNCPGDAVIIRANNNQKPTSTYAYTFGGGNLASPINTGATNNYTIPNPVAGIYFVTITETTGTGTQTTATASTTVSLAPVPNPTSLPALSLRCGNGCGPIDAGNGVGTYVKWRWSNGDSTQIARACTQGVYTVTVTNGYGCSATGTTTVDSLTVMFNFASENLYADCEGKNGRIQVDNVVGGAQAGFQYWLNDNIANAQYSNILNGVDADTAYTVWTRDTLGCLASTTVTIRDANTVLPAPTVVASTLIADCEGKRGQIIVNNVTGGGGPEYRYWIDNNSANPQYNTVFTNVNAGTYTVWSVDTLKCKASTSVTVQRADVVLPPPALTATTNYADCEGNNGQITVTNVTGGGGAIFKYWIDTNTPQYSPILKPITAGAHTIYTIDTLKCRGTLNIIVPRADEVLPQPQIKVSTRTADCDGKNGTILIDGVQGGAGAPYRFVFNGQPQAANDSLIFRNLAYGNYTITLIDSLRCKDTLQATVPRLYHPEVDYTVTPPTIFVGDSARITPTIVRGQVVRWAWTDSDELSCGFCAKPIAAPFQTATYIVTITDNNYCTATRSVTITVQSKTDVYAPNIITPNGDGANDIFMLFAGRSLVKIKNLQIFNRWGAMVFENKNYNPNSLTDGWDGTYKGTELMPDVFVWRAEVEYSDGTSRIIQGDVAIVR
jgi:gliding motility-associated-like protein